MEQIQGITKKSTRKLGYLKNYIKVRKTFLSNILNLGTIIENTDKYDYKQVINFSMANTN